MLKLLIIAMLLGMAPAGFTQTLNVCSSAASDSDGDGFGFENNRSCVVSELSDVAPEFINQENGQPVLLIRAIWTAEDFLTPIACSEEYFDGSSYTRIRPAALLEFGPLPNVAPFVGEVDLSVSPLSSTRVNDIPWNIDNGIYTGPTGLGYSPWVEIIDDERLDAQFTRVWTSDNAYTLCTTVNPAASFAPTGIAPDPISEFDGSTCVDTDPVGDGWGWNGSTSCRLEVTNRVCIDSPPVGDGFGWNGVSTCLIN